MNCTQCGSPIDADAAWCSNCGAKVNNAPAQPAQPVAQPMQTTQPVAQPVQPVAQPAQSAQPAQPAPQFTQPMQQPYNPGLQTNTNFAPSSNAAPNAAPASVAIKMSKKNKIIVSVVVVLVAILGLAYYFIQQNLYSPEATVKRYVTALENGNFTEANSLIDWTSSNVPEGTRILMTNSVGKNTKNRIANSTITDVSYNSKRVSYKINGAPGSFIVELAPPKSQWLVFKSYKLKYPTVSTLPIDVLNYVKALKINGTLVDLNKYEKSSKKDGAYGYTDNNGYSNFTRYNIPVYPGTYSVDLVLSTSLLKAGAAKDVDVSEPGKEPEPVFIEVKSTKQLKQSINDAIKKEVDSCIASTDPTVPKNCNFAVKLPEESYGFLSVNKYNYADIKRTVEEYPKVTSVDSNYSSFNTDYSTVKVKYRYKLDDSNNWSEDSRESRFSMGGTYKIKGDKVVVNFYKDSDSDY